MRIGDGVSLVNDKNENKHSSYMFLLTMGDKGGDGHNIRQDVLVGSSHPKECIRSAYNNSTKIAGRLRPDVLCGECEDNSVSDGNIKELKKCGFEFHDPEWITYDEMARYTLWFIMQGNPEIKLTIMHLNQLLDHSVGYGVEQF